MKVNIVEYDEEDQIVLEIVGEGHTFANLIREMLSEVKEVDSAGYHKEHPFIEKVKLVIKAAPKKKLDKAIKNSCKSLTKLSDEFYKLVEKAV